MKNYGDDHDNNDLFFATEIEANYNKNQTPQPMISISQEPKIRDGELTSGRGKQQEKYMLPQIIDPKSALNNQLVVFQNSDKVLDIDQRIHDKFMRSKSQKGWAK